MTQTFKLGHAANEHWKTLTDRCLEQIGQLPQGANIGFVYITDLLDTHFQSVFDRLRDSTGIEHWIGTIGMGIFVGGREYFGEPAMVAMAGALPEDSFRILPTIETPGQAVPDELHQWAAEAGSPVGIVHGDPRNAYLADILDSISDDTDAMLAGGLTSSNGSFTQVAGDLTEQGISGVLFSEKIRTSRGLSQGCQPIGEIHEVTAASYNLVYALDDRSALSVLRDEIDALSSDRSPSDRISFHAAFPIAGSVSGDYLVRNVTSINTDTGAVQIDSRVAPGDRLLFVRRNQAAALEDLDRMLSEVTAGTAEPAKAALYYSCVARGPNLFDTGSYELTTVQAALGEDVPVIGFFGNGEICDNRLYAYTGVLTILH